MTRRLQTTKERALTLIRAAIGECHTREESDDEGVSVSILAEPPPCRGFIPVVLTSGKTLNDAWANAMDAARERATGEVLRFDREVAQAETAGNTDAAARLREARLTLIRTLNGCDDASENGVEDKR